MLTKSQAEDYLTTKVDPASYQPERTALEQLQLRCLAYFCGKQHFYQEGPALLEIDYEDEIEVRYRANLIWPAIERAVAKVMNSSAAMRVAPKSGSPHHRTAALTSDRVLTHVQQQRGYRRRREEATRIAAIMGSAFIKTTWDDRIGDLRRFYGDRSRTVLPATREEEAELERQGLFEDLYEGDIRYDVVTPFSFHWDWNSRTDLDACQWCAEMTYQSISHVAEMYDLRERDIVPDDNIGSSSAYEQTLAFITSGNGTTPYTYMPRQLQMEGRTSVTELWHRPTRKYPQGMHIVRIGPNVIKVDKNPYRMTGRPLPFAKIDWAPCPKRFIGLGIAEHIMAPQHRYNESRGKMTEFQNVWGQAPMYVGEGGISPENVHIKPGRVYEYNRTAGKIEPGPTPTYPPEVAQNAQIASGEIDRISSMSDPDMSGLPGQIRSGEGMRAFFNEKNLLLSTSQRSVIEADQEVAVQTLGLVRANYGNDRTLKVTGLSGMFEILTFQAADVHNDVHIVSDVRDADSILAYKAELGELLQIGALDPANNPKHRRLMYNAYQFNTHEEILDDFTLDQANQEREIQDMIADPVRFQQKPYPVAEFEDHEVHSDTLARFMKTDEFRSLDPVTQGVLYVHYQMHQQALAEIMQKQIEMQEAIKGSPGEKGKASQPRRAQ